MSDFHIHINSTDQHMVISESVLQEIERTPTAYLFYFAGEDHKVTIEIPTNTIEIITATLNMFQTYPTVRKVST